jgi:uncharacterized protein (UPF0261 family)
MKTIVILGTLDTKGREAEFLRQEILAWGHSPLVIDTGVVGKPAFTADVYREEVARRGGSSLEQLLQNPEREKAAPVMARGAREIVIELFNENKIHGIISMGGTQGTTLSTEVMRSLPIGFPKVMVSTMASGNTAPFVDIKDIAMIPSIADIMGLNPITRKILSNAACAVCGMADSKVEIRIEKPLVGITTVGITTQCALKAQAVLEKRGYETIVFHAVGSGGRAMEELIKHGHIKAVLDITPIEVTNEMYGGLLAADRERLTVAGKYSLPQLLAPGAIAVNVYGTPDTIPERFRDRKRVRHSPKITNIRLVREEQEAVAREILRRLSHTKEPAIFMIPTKGYDYYSTEGNCFWEPESDSAFVHVLKQGLPGNFTVIERDTHINDPAFATEMAERLIELIEKKYE